MNVNKGFTNRSGNALSSLRSMVNSKGMEAQLRAALPSVITPERFIRLTLSAISTTPELANCSQSSFFGAMFQAAQLGLEPNTPTGQAYLIPFGGKVQFVLGYRGYIQLAYRSGDITDISAHVVYENDKFDYELGLAPKLSHKPALGKRGKAIAVYAVYHTRSGGYGMEVMSMEEIADFAKKKSKSFNKGPWQTDREEMAKKTVVKRLLKYAPISSEFVRAVSADETVKDFDPAKDTAANLLDEMGTITIEAEKGGETDSAPQTETQDAKAQPQPQQEPEEEIPMDWGEPAVNPETGEVSGR